MAASFPRRRESISAAETSVLDGSRLRGDGGCGEKGQRDDEGGSHRCGPHAKNWLASIGGLDLRAVEAETFLREVRSLSARRFEQCGRAAAKRHRWLIREFARTCRGTQRGAVAPRHIAIIMDGNGRWAAQRGLPRTEGHRRGVESTKECVRAAADAGISYLTLFSFSSENWKRPPGELRLLLTSGARR